MMEKKLFLSANFSTVAGLLPDFVGDDLRGKKVTFIPTASMVEKLAFYVGLDKAALGRLGLVVDELEIATASEAEIATKISGNEIIFVEGGNLPRPLASPSSNNFLNSTSHRFMMLVTEAQIDN
jgi:dipeptidase E